MTATAAPAGAAGSGTGRRGPGLIVLVVVGVIVLTVVVLAFVAPSQRNDGPALDPTSTGPDGTRAAVELAGRLGADVEVRSELPGPDVDVAIAFEDVVGADQQPDLLDWVAAGHTLVIADPGSDLTPPVAADVSEPFDDSTVVRRDGCDVTRPVGVDRLTELESFGPAYRFEVPDGATGCFTDGDGSVVVVEPVGQGLVVSVATPWVFTNQALDQADNAGLFAALAVPERGTRLAVLVAGPDGTGLQPDGDGSLGLPTGVSLALVQLLVAFVVYALFRARRLGRPVPEDPPVEIAGSELTRAVGGLLEHAGARDRAARSLRRAARRRLASAHGLAVGIEPATVVATVAGRSGLDADRLDRALLDRPVADDEALAALARELDDIVGAALAPGAPARGAPPPGGPATDTAIDQDRHPRPSRPGDIP